MDQKIQYAEGVDKSILKPEFLATVSDQYLTNLLESTRKKFEQAQNAPNPDPFLTEGFQADIKRIEEEIERRKAKPTA